MHDVAPPKVGHLKSVVRPSFFGLADATAAQSEVGAADHSQVANHCRTMARELVRELCAEALQNNQDDLLRYKLSSKQIDFFVVNIMSGRFAD